MKSLWQKATTQLPKSFLRFVLLWAGFCIYADLFVKLDALSKSAGYVETGAGYAGIVTIIFIWLMLSELMGAPYVEPKWKIDRWFEKKGFGPL